MGCTGRTTAAANSARGNNRAAQPADTFIVKIKQNKNTVRIHGRVPGLPTPSQKKHLILCAQCAKSGVFSPEKDLPFAQAMNSPACCSRHRPVCEANPISRCETERPPGETNQHPLHKAPMVRLVSPQETAESFRLSQRRRFPVFNIGGSSASPAAAPSRRTGTAPQPAAPACSARR